MRSLAPSSPSASPRTAPSHLPFAELLGAALVLTALGLALFA
jgi:hypothetical protein